MNRIAAASAALLATTALAQAGGLDRNQLGTGILFEQGTYVELGYSTVNPSVTGALAANGTASGSIAPSYGFATLGYHHDLSDTLSFSLMIDAPYGADVAYPGLLGTTGYPFAGSTAEVRSQQITAAIRGEINQNMSVYGGLRALRVQGEAFVTAFSGPNATTVQTPLGPAAPASLLTGFNYRLQAESDWSFGYMLGAAYEIPEIALRVGLTYFSEIETTLTGMEGVDLIATPIAGGLGAIAPLLGQPVAAASMNPTSIKSTMPQAVLVEAQSGIAADTLLFGSVRWTNWEGYSLVPSVYPGGALISYDKDVWTWNLGIGRRINESLALSASIGHEAEQDGFSSNLGPTDGRTSLGIGAEYSIGALSVAGGVQYSMIGDAQTEGSPAGTVLANFNDNTATAIGIRIGYQF